MKQTLTLEFIPTPCEKADLPKVGETVLVLTNDNKVYTAEYYYEFRKRRFYIPALKLSALETEVSGFAKIPESIS